jgi:Ca-activated chloride channel family protein
VGFVRRLGADDLAQVITFDNQAVVQQAFTSDPQLLEKAIRRTTANGSTALYMAVYIALSDLKRTYDRPAEGVRRQAIVLLSDGDDTTSLIDYDQVLEEAKRSNVVIYSIALRSRQDQASHEYGSSGGDLRWLATVSGGRSFLVTEPAQLPAIYQKIADELASQYMIGYVSTNSKRDGAWRPVSVGVDRPETVVRTRAGYFAPTVPR